MRPGRPFVSRHIVALDHGSFFNVHVTADKIHRPHSIGQLKIVTLRRLQATWCPSFGKQPLPGNGHHLRGYVVQHPEDYKQTPMYEWCYPVWWPRVASLRCTSAKLLSDLLDPKPANPGGRG